MSDNLPNNTTPAHVEDRFGGEQRDPQRDPRAGDQWEKWGIRVTVDRISMGCVYTTPQLTADTREWIGITRFQRWTAEARFLNPSITAHCDGGHEAAEFSIKVIGGEPYCDEHRKCIACDAEATCLDTRGDLACEKCGGPQ